MKKQSFRMKVVLSSFLVMALGLLYVNIHSSLLFTTLFRMNFLYFFGVSAAVTLLLNIVLSAVLGVVYFQVLKPFQRVIDEIDAGRKPSDELYRAGRRAVLRLPKAVLTGTLAVMILPSIGDAFSTAVIGGGFTNFLFNVFFTAVFALLQIAFHTMILAEPRRKLNIIHISGEEKQRWQPFLVTRGLITFCFASFISMTFFFTHGEIAKYEHRYTDLLEKVTRGELTVEEVPGRFTEPLLKESFAPLIRTELFSVGNISSHGRLDFVFWFLWVSLSAIVLLVSAAWDKDLSNQIRNVRMKIGEILEGNGDLSTRVEITQFNDIGELADSLNTLMEKLNGMLLSVARTSHGVVRASGTLQEVVSATSSAAEQISSSLERIGSRTEGQMETVIRTDLSLSEALSSFTNIEVNIETQSRFVDETSSAVTEMAQSIRSVSETSGKASELAQNLTQVAGRGRDAVNSSITAIREIETASREVNAIVSVISKIASQTNLLAMNAAIEAAHAGSAGLGFAVVAEEVRNLAESSSKSTKEITKHIKGMMERVNNGVMLSEEAGIALEHISSDINRTVTLMNEISSAMKEQAAGTSQILQAITSLVESTNDIRKISAEQRENNVEASSRMKETVEAFRQIRAVTEEQMAGNREILKAVGHLKSVADENRSVIVNLESLLSGFRLEETEK